ncbi:lysoplasmalogenase [Legionella taurinensis]|uniref:Lysoplasmalogenase n=1 Tax=Legionella taurinensis TaxID=70611 RepID=A0AB38N9Q1_9GAMM|nr:lysoplasmalogenase [Legionella taurinensis]MDX1836101.1 lysoplasmalogenase [Legionella taurinensis]PUT42201.1 lysoplasmalogenase [Legionella taurinensis]PUT44989.1 lysoplasmalogenase [Legionella taurinensis]PUT48310.1 lysoplasmalogenase [Legionella taurinensis]PUT49123.1 lysoplasmalogenase [Legionella taurinensis]
MAHELPKRILTLFLVFAFLYLLLLPFIDYPLTTILKPLPIVCLMILVKTMPQDFMIKLLLTLALGFSLAGDVVLTHPSQLAFMIGMVCFLLAHCVYINLFLRDFQFNRNRLFISLIPLSLAVAGYSYFHTAFGQLAIPILVYLIALLTMVFSAFQVRQQAGTIISGACLFLVSDSLLGLGLFVIPSRWMPLAVMLTYYLAQLFITTGVLNRQLETSPQSVNPYQSV